MKLILLRHGKTEANEKHLYCGSTDIPISDSGNAELQILKETILYPDIRNFRVITSGMIRCEETLKIIYGIMPHGMMPELREMDFGVFEMYSYEQLKNDEEYVKWISGDNEENIAPGGESGNIMKARVILAFKKIMTSMSDTVIVTHGGVIAAIMEQLFPGEGKNRYEWQPKPGRGYQVLIEAMLSYTLF